MSRDPETIQREIERTRDALAETLDTLTERVSPRRVAERGRRLALRKLGSPEAVAVMTVAAGVTVLLIVRRRRVHR